MGTLDRPTTGDVFIKGVNVNEMTDNELADIRNLLIGFVFQFHYLLPEFTAIENVLMPYRIRVITSYSIHYTKLYEVLELVTV